MPPFKYFVWVAMPGNCKYDRGFWDKDKAQEYCDEQNAIQHDAFFFVTKWSGRGHADDSYGRTLYGIYVETVKFNPKVPEMDEDKQWAVIYTYHDWREDFYVGVVSVIAPDIGIALREADAALEVTFAEQNWSDYFVVNAILLKEVQ